MWGYIEDVIEGQRAACRELRWGCERYKRDFESGEWDYRVEEADFVIDKIKGIDGRIIQATPSQISDRFARAIRFSGSPHFRFHDLRHYSASIMHAMGVPDQYIMSRGGWRTDTVLKAVYRNTISSEQKKQDQLINKHFKNMYEHV